MYDVTVVVIINANRESIFLRNDKAMIKTIFESKMTCQLKEYYSCNRLINNNFLSFIVSKLISLTDFRL